jgi:hypothetical protein
VKKVGVVRKHRAFGRGLFDLAPASWSPVD